MPPAVCHAGARRPWSKGEGGPLMVAGRSRAGLFRTQETLASISHRGWGCWAGWLASCPEPREGGCLREEKVSYCEWRIQHVYITMFSRRDKQN